MFTSRSNPGEPRGKRRKGKKGDREEERNDPTHQRVFEQRLICLLRLHAPLSRVISHFCSFFFFFSFFPH